MSSPFSLRIPRALSLLLVAQLVLQAPVLAQGEAAPGWNEEKDIMSTFASEVKSTSEPKAAESKAVPPLATEAVKSDTQAIKSEVPGAPSEAQTTPVQAQTTGSEAPVATESAKIEASAVKGEAQTTKSEVPGARSEAQATPVQAQTTRSEAPVVTESAKIEAQAVKGEAQTAKSDASLVETATAGDPKLEVKADSPRGSGAAAGKEIAEIEKSLPLPTSDALILQGAPQSGAQAGLKAEEKPGISEATGAATTAATAAGQGGLLVVDTDDAATKSAQTGPADKLTQPAADGTSTAAVSPAAITLPASAPGSLLSIPTEAAPTLGTINTADQLGADMVHQLGATVSTVLGTVNAAQNAAQEEVIVVDCDENAEVEKVVEYENLPTDEGKTRIKSGARFPVIVTSQISSKTAKKGDPLEARLKYDLKVGERLVAKKGSVVRGHINYSLRARSVMHSLVSPERWYRNSGCLGVEFDEILSEKGEHIPLVACPAKTARIVKNKGEGRVLGVNHLGQVTGPWSQQLKYKAIRIGLNAALAPAGAFSFGAMPVALGVIGAANPSFAFMKPVGTNVRHRRIKGFAWGFLSGIPGSFLIEDTVTRGQEAIIKPGDEFLAEFKEEFTGEPASEAELMPNAHVKVHGDVRTSGKKK